MTEDAEKKIESQKLQAPSDALARPSVIRTKEDEALWERMNARHILGKDESATDLLCISDDDKAKSKLEITGIQDNKVQKSVALSIDERYVEGLKALGNDEEAQGLYSIEYIERKAQEVLTALQEPKPDQVLLASNITPSVPNLEQIQQYEASQSDVSPREAVTAWDSKDLKARLEKSVYPHRDKRENFVDSDAARSASQRFSRLAAYSQRHEGIGPQLITAILENEQTYYRSDKDAIPDAIVRKTGALPLDMTIGPAQMKISNVRHLAEKYPEILGSAKDSTHLATDKWYATMLVGAYLDDKIETFEKWSKQPPVREKLSKDDRYQFDHAFPFWKTGMETKALAMSYNPAGGQDHLKNILKYLD